MSERPSIGGRVTRHEYTNKDVWVVFQALRVNQGRISTAFGLCRKMLEHDSEFLVWLIEEVEELRKAGVQEETLWEEWVRRHSVEKGTR